MRKNFGSKTYLYPQPVFIISTYGEDGSPDAMSAAWGGICDHNKVMLCLSEGHKTTHNILKRKAFVINIADVANVVACDYVGIVSANDVPDKLAATGWQLTPSQFVDAPVIQNLKLALECRLDKVNEDGLIIGEIVNVSADESVLTDGKIDPALLKPVTFDAVNNKYLVLGEAVGDAFSCGKAIKK